MSKVAYDTVEQYIAKLEQEVETLKKQLNDDPRHWRFDWQRKYAALEVVAREVLNCDPAIRPVQWMETREKLVALVG